MSRTGSIDDVLRNQGRGVVGALLVAGLPFLYTMESWWLGWRLPLSYLLVYAFVGLAVVSLIARNVGFREEEEEGTQRNLYRAVTSFTELVLQSFVAAYVVLLLFGIAELDDSPIQVVRLGLVQVVPLGFGAALANQLLRESDESQAEAKFPENLAVFALGAAFVAFPISATQEMELMAVHASWGRLSVLVVVSLLVVHLVLHELQFRGHGGRVHDRPRWAQVGTTFVAYGVGVVLSVLLLASFGHFAGATLEVAAQETIVLSFLASVGASAGEVVL